MEDRVIELEIRVAYQEALLLELNDAIVAQGRMIDRLRLELERLRDQLRTQAPSPVAPPSEETPPPHY